MNGKVEGVTVSHMFETFVGGQKQSHFLSMKVSFDPPLDEEEFYFAQLKFAKQCTIANLQNAMLRGTVDQDGYTEALRVMKENHHNMEESMKKQIEKRRSQSTTSKGDVK